MKPNLNNTTNLIIDMDGVLWHGEKPLAGLQDFFRTLRELNLGFVLATNNATKTADQYAEKLANFGVRVDEEFILTSSEATAHYLAKVYPAGASVFVVGEAGLTLAMERQGFRLVVNDGFVGRDAAADVVVVGMTRHFCYMDLASAAFLVSNGARFVGTNPDVTFPTEVGPLPGAGSILAFIEAATGVKPLVIGKPNKAVFEEALSRLDAKAESTLMVGDRLNTDIAGGYHAGLGTVLLLTGISDRSDLAAAEIKPDLIFEDLESFSRYLRQHSKVAE